MNTVEIKLIGNPLKIIIREDLKYLGSQYDNFASKLVFRRPDKFERTSLLLFFDDGRTKFAPVNIGTENEFILSNYFTQTTILKLQVAFERDEIIQAHSDVYMFFLIKSIRSGDTVVIEKPKSKPRLVEQAITDVDYKNNSLNFRNLSGDTVQSVFISGAAPYIGDNGNWYEWSGEILEYVDTGVCAQVEKGENGERGPAGPQGEQGPAGPQGEPGPAGPQGERGADGTGITILGSFDSVSELPSGDIGEAYLVGGFLHVWSEAENGWMNVGEIRGPKGDSGEQGPAGPQGERGTDGTGITILGSFESVSELPSGDIGEAYLVGGFLHVWSEAENGWMNVGEIRGPKGDSGEQGPAGPQGEPGSTTADGVSYSNPTLPGVEDVKAALDTLLQEGEPGSGNGINPNLIINGSLRVWQRGTSFTAPQNAYTADRMKCNGTGTVTRAAATGGIKITGTINLKYIMEDLDYAQISGKTVTLSYNKDGIITADTYQSDRYSAVTGGRIVIDLNLTAGTYNWIKLELGGIATQFIPRSMAEEISLCQRYYEKSYSLDVVPGTSGATAVLAHPMRAVVPQSTMLRGQAYAVIKRLAATVKIYSYIGTENAITELSGANVAGVTVTGAQGNGSRGFYVLMLSAALPDTVTYTYHWTADAEL